LNRPTGSKLRKAASGLAGATAEMAQPGHERRLAQIDGQVKTWSRLGAEVRGKQLGDRFTDLKRTPPASATVRRQWRPKALRRRLLDHWSVLIKLPFINGNGLDHSDLVCSFQRTPDLALDVMQNGRVLRTGRRPTAFARQLTSALGAVQPLSGRHWRCKADVSTRGHRAEHQPTPAPVWFRLRCSRNEQTRVLCNRCDAVNWDAARGCAGGRGWLDHTSGASGT
jgi:hypothetical protein